MVIYNMYPIPETFSSTHEYGGRQQTQAQQRASAVGGERGGQGGNVEMKRRSQSMPRSESNYK